MTIVLSKEDLGSLELTPAEAKLNLAIGLYSGSQISLGRAARISGLSQHEFKHELGKRGVLLNYTLKDVEHDIQMAEVFVAERKNR